MQVLVTGVYGEAQEDPEPALQRLVDAAAPGSTLRLFFGPEYWSCFIAERRQQLAPVEMQAECWVEEPDWNFARDEVMSACVLELRLLERVIKECHQEAQLCERELVCAGKVLQRTLVDREDIRSVLREAD